MARRVVVTVLATATLVAACTATDDAAPGGSTVAERPVVTPLPVTGTIELTAEVIDGCEPLSDRHCSLPFPSNALTTPDPETDTGLRLDLREGNMPVNADGVPVAPGEWNRNDGFSPGTPLLVSLPGVDLEASAVADQTDFAASLTADAPIVLVDLDTGDRHPYWAELDANAEDPASQLLVVRPAVNFREGHRYAVGLRDLVDVDGDPIGSGEVFRAYRDGLDTGVPSIEDRRSAMEEVFAGLARAGVERERLVLAWDFTIASERNLSERLLHIRDDAFAALGDEAPRFVVTEVVEPTGDDAEHVASRVAGTFEVPLYLTGAGEPGEAFNWGPEELPARNGTYEASFLCTIPQAAVATDAGPARPVVYGHGLLGTRNEVTAGNIALMADEHDMIYCATDWIGMSTFDVPNVLSILGDFGRLPTLADRVQQGILDSLFLGRLLVHDDGFASDPAFQVDGHSLLDTGEVYYDSNSEGAIIGGAATAVAQDWTRAVLGVPGMNYSTLLRRSVDFDLFSAVFEPSYADESEQALALALAQILWDRAETNGYAHHLAREPYPGTPEHQVLLHVAFGDHQVADTAAFVEARTLGAGFYDPLLRDGRGEIDYAFGLEPITLPFAGSAVVMWDSGVAPPPLVNVPPRGEGDPQGPHDPHEDPRAMTSAREQKSAFLSPDGEVIDVCDGAACLADRR